MCRDRTEQGGVRQGVPVSQQTGGGRRDVSLPPSYYSASVIDPEKNNLKVSVSQGYTSVHVESCPELIGEVRMDSGTQNLVKASRGGASALESAGTSGTRGT